MFLIKIFVLQVNTLNEITITLSVEQLYLLNILASQTNEYILSHLKANKHHTTLNEKMQLKYKPESRTYDNGIDSAENNGNFFENGSVPLIENKINSQSNIGLFTKK